MKIVKENLWKVPEAPGMIVVTTNGYLRSDGSVVMGRGAAFEATKRIPGIDKEAGALIEKFGGKATTELIISSHPLGRSRAPAAQKPRRSSPRKERSGRRYAPARARWLVPRSTILSPVTLRAKLRIRLSASDPDRDIVPTSGVQYGVPMQNYLNCRCHKMRLSAIQVLFWTESNSSVTICAERVQLPLPQNGLSAKKSWVEGHPKIQTARERPGRKGVMMNLSEIQIIGRLGKEPEAKLADNGEYLYCKFSLAVDRVYPNRDGNQVKEVTWFSITTWGKLAETCHKYLSKGRLVRVVGRLQPDTTGGPRIWMGTDGKPHASFEVVANSVLFLSPKPQAGDEPAAEAVEEEIPFS